MRRRALLAGPLLAAHAHAQGSALAPLGHLRAVYLAGNPVRAVRDPASGAVRGIAIDLATELGRRGGVPLAFTARPSRRVAAGRSDSVGLLLSRTLASATFIPLDNVASAALARRFAAGEIDAFAASGLRLPAAEIPGSRVLPGSFFGVPQAIIVPADAPARLALVDAFLLAILRDGFLQSAIARSNREAEIEA